LLCWIEKNFDLIFSKFDYSNISVIKLLENINDEICKIKKRDFSFEIKCPQIKELFNKWKNNIFFNVT
jgi:prophage tail gpP-like protein